MFCSYHRIYLKVVKNAASAAVSAAAAVAVAILLNVAQPTGPGYGGLPVL